MMTKINYTARPKVLVCVLEGMSNQELELGIQSKMITQPL